MVGRVTALDAGCPVIHNCTRELLVIDGHALAIVPGAATVEKEPMRVVSRNPGLQKTMLVEGVVIGLVLMY
jgi:hypothetical protein